MRIWVQLSAGEGSRFGSVTPKQFLRLGRKPLLTHSLATFLSLWPESPVIVVLPLAHFARGRTLVQKYFPQAQLHFVVGGATRSASTEAALAYLQKLEALRPEVTIAFHDAARPFPSAALIERVFKTAQEKGAAVCGLPVRFSLRKVEGDTSQALPRESIWEVQTPQAFRGDILASAWEKLSPTAEAYFTDEGSWIEAAGLPVAMVSGEPTNLKVTYPIDWEVARTLLRRGSL
ncbi:MAG: 2-C-methyl-D-erythritol 4-phosphate cytidylyltransferase [Bacteroidia bacterium]|nr:2-C-methyl-D-erythritol 4-phosphate cytidylyltransferase [Bacteroidia bacterium]GIV23408.1 MAG: 2-C-methyl-D-erythritol 4-phosphate cytidylyltransferase [Bacteroidia bacterium]